MADSVAQDQIKAYVDRVLRMKEERKAIDADIREIYAEAKGNGFDKTVLGKLVNYIEKRNADSNAVAEGEALFDLYLTAYYGAGTKVATHTHEAVPKPQSRPTAGSDLTTPPSLNGQVAPLSPETATNVGEAQKVERRSPKPEDAGSIPAADANPAPEGPAEVIVPGMGGATPPAGANTGSSNGRTAAFEAVNVGSSPAPVTNTVDFRTALRPHCLKPHSCGGMGREHCWSCKKAMNAAGAA